MRSSFQPRGNGLMEARVLLTGATGYIGGRLLRRFEQRRRSVRCLVREPARLRPPPTTTQGGQGDCLDAGTLDPAMTGIDTAYYLVHSMAAGRDFAQTDRRAAENFG